MAKKRPKNSTIKASIYYISTMYENPGRLSQNLNFAKKREGKPWTGP